MIFEVATVKRPTVALVLSSFFPLTFSAAAAAESDNVEEALAEVRDVKAALFSRESSVLGTLPGPAETAAHQLRCRPISKPQAGAPRKIRFDEATQQRAACR